jgi:hypothetical protein
VALVTSTLALNVISPVSFDSDRRSRTIEVVGGSPGDRRRLGRDVPGARGAWTAQASFAALKAWVQHTHVHDSAQQEGKIACLPMETGIVDTRRAMALLVAAGHTGYLSGEWINGEPAEVHLPREIETMVGYEAYAYSSGG